MTYFYARAGGARSATPASATLSGWSQTKMTPTSKWTPPMMTGNVTATFKSNTMDNRERQEQIVRSAAKLTQAEREAVAERILEETPVPMVDERFAKLLGIAEEVAGHTMTSTRDWENVSIRRMVAYRMKEEGFRLSHIARAMHLHHSTVLHYIRQMKDIFDEPIFYAVDIRKYVDFTEAVEEAERDVE